MKLDKSISTNDLMQVNFRYHYSESELLADWLRLTTTREYKTGAQFKPGMKLCQHFCDNFWAIENDSGLSFEKCWNDYELMDKVRQWGLTGMSELWLSWIRRAVYMSAGLPNSSYYRPHFSKQICEMSLKSGGILFDPCHGWGGRMLGTMAADWNYIGCDPNLVTYTNVSKILDFVQSHSNQLFTQSTTTLLNIPAEDYDYANSPRVDIVLTSPPYFNLERYNNDPDQSYNKHATYESWRDNWLYFVMEQCIMILNDDGISCWNVMNFGKNNIVQDVIDFHKSRGFELVTTVGFNSPLANIRKLKNKDVTYIFARDPAHVILKET